MELILIYIVVFGALMMFLTTRGRKKQASQAQMLQQALTVGAEVRTIGGMVGIVTELTDEYVIVETTPGVKLKFTKQAIAGVIPPEEASEQESETVGEDSLTPAEQEAVAEDEADAEAGSESEPEDAKDQQKVG